MLSKETTTLIIEEDYIITPQFMYMIGDINLHGTLCTEIIETSKTVIIDKPPVEILNASIQAIGFDLKGVLETSKWLLGSVHLCPIMVNPLHQLVLFPTHSPKNIESIWLNPRHVHSTSGSNELTFILFNNGKTIIAPVGISVFNKALENAKQLEEMSVQSADRPYTFVLDPKNRYKSKN